MSKFIEKSRFRDKNLSVFNHNLSLPRHRWYTFKEGFSETLVKTAIKTINKGSNKKIKIIDPFSGSATSLVSAGRFGHQATGIEVNPFLAFAGSAKCSPSGWEESEFNTVIKKVLSDSVNEIPSSLEEQSTFTEREGKKKWLFNRSVLRGFAAIDKALEQTEKFQKPLRLALFASLIEYCNAKRDGKCLRYRKGWEKNGYSSAELRTEFTRRAKIVFSDISEKDFAAEGLNVILGDTKEKLGELPGEIYDLAITSPPYLNSFDYSDVYRPELFVGGFVKDNKELTEIRKQTVRSHVQVPIENLSSHTNPRLVEILPRLAEQPLWNKQIPTMVTAYFTDMAVVLNKLAQTVKPNGQAWIVVSTSAYCGVEIPVDLILADIAEENGWELCNVNVLRRMRSAGQHHSKAEDAKKLPLRESLIILQKPK